MKLKFSLVGSSQDVDCTEALVSSKPIKFVMDLLICSLDEPRTLL